MSPIGLLTHNLHDPNPFESLISVQKIAKTNEYQIPFNNPNAFQRNKVQGRKIGLEMYGDPPCVLIERDSDGSWFA